MRGVAGRGPMIRPWPNRRTPLRVGRFLSTLAAQFLHACARITAKSSAARGRGGLSLFIGSPYHARSGQPNHKIALSICPAHK
jgi:hypothetical protein